MAKSDATKRDAKIAREALIRQFPGKFGGGYGSEHEMASITQHVREQIRADIEREVFAYLVAEAHRELDAGDPETNMTPTWLVRKERERNQST